MQRTLSLLLILLTLPSLSQVDAGLVAKITFNNGKGIEEVSGKSIKLENAPLVTDRFGNNGMAAYVHGSQGSYINLGNSSNLKPKHGTVSLWFMIEVIMESGKGYQFNPIILTKNGVLDSAGKNNDFFEAYGISYDYKIHKIVTASSQSEKLQVNVRSVDTVTLYKWHHVAMTYDDKYLALYLDGKLNAKLPKNFNTVFSPTDSVILGYTADEKNQRYFCGALDDIFIYDRVLTDEEILGLYKAPNPNKFTRTLYFLKWIGIFVLAVGITVWLILRRLRKGLLLQKEKNEILARMNEIETAAIRSQMNPHFIFNSLNTLQRLILDENILAANDYLVKFSLLLRKLLECGVSESISLKEEIEILNSYVEIEKLRFDKPFEFELKSDIVHPAAIQIPFMLVQPFVENAIWHGLLPKKENRKLSVFFKNLDDQRLTCTIQDNGVGREYSHANKDPRRKKSMAIDFIRQRLDLLQKATGIEGKFNIIDLTDSSGRASGTTVEITIPKIS